MLYKLTIEDADLKEFLSGIIKHSYRETVARWLKQIGLNWDSYWDVFITARAPLVAALLYTAQLPSLAQMTKIILEEKRQGPRSTILKSQNNWWAKSSKMQGLLLKFYENLTQEQFLWLFKINGHVYAADLIKFCNPKLLPLILGQKCDHLITQRLSGKLEEPQ
jgi:hypothetical protein